MSNALVVIDDKNQVLLTILHNPFDVSHRTIKRVPMRYDQSLTSFLIEHVAIDDNQEYHVSINGKVYDTDSIDDQVVRVGDSVAVCAVLKGGGKGKNPLAILAGLALAFVAFGVGTWATAAYSATVGNLATGLIMMVGGQLISNVFAPSMSQEGTDEQSYKWGALQPITAQGAVIPITYGTIRTAGQILSQHVASDEDVQFLYVLACGGEGPIDTIENIKINDNPIENYTDVEFHVRKGTNDQELIEGFNNLYDDQYLSFTLSTGTDGNGNDQAGMPGDWSTQITDGDFAEGLEVEISFMQGLYGMDDEGKSHETSVTIEIEYARDTGGSLSFTRWDIPNGGTIKRRALKPFTMVFRQEHITPARYHVRARCIRKDSVNPERGANLITWSKLSVIVYQPMIHPNKALLAVKIRATEQLSGGMPTITWDQTRKTVLVWENNAWIKKDAQNPAWIVYDLCVKARELSGEVVVFGESPDMMDYAAFKRWATFNDRQVNGRAAMKMNLLIDSSKRMWEWINEIAVSARGAVVMKGTVISCLFDTKSDPVQLFSVGNTLEGSFSGEYLSLDNRANAVEIAFFNETKNYEREQITVYGDGFDNMDVNANPVSVQLTGVTDFERAYREGMYRLFQNQYLLRTVTLRVSIDAIACQVGDVVNIQHDVPLWGQGGRIVEIDNNHLIIDNYIQRMPSPSTIMIRKRTDEIVTMSVMFVGSGEETNELSVASVTGIYPGDVFAISSPQSTIKQFRIQQITRDSDLHATLTCTEYDERVFNDDFYIPPYGDGGGGGVLVGNSIRNLSFFANGDYNASGMWVPTLWARWSYTGEVPLKYELEWSDNGGAWYGNTTTTESVVLAPTVSEQTKYGIRVRALYTQSPPSDWAYATSEGVEFGNGIAPDPPTDLEAFGWLGFAELRWKNPKNPDLSHVEVWEAFEDDLVKATKVGQSPSENFNRLLPAGGVTWYWVRAVNHTGQYSRFNSEAGTMCVIDPESFQALIDEILKRPEIKEALEQLQKPIDELRDLSDILAEEIIRLQAQSWEASEQRRLIEALQDKLAELAINGDIQDHENLRYSLALIIDEARKREEDGEAFAQKLEGVIAMIGDPRNPGPDTVYSAIKDEMTARAVEGEATGKRINEIITSIGDPSNPSPTSVYGAIRTEENARATADEANASQINTVASIVGNPEDPQPGTAFGAIRDESVTRATAIEAEAARREQLQAKLTTDIGTVNAAVMTETTARVNGDSSLAQNINTVQSSLNGNITSVETLSESVNGMGTKWSTKLDNNGYITGLVMNNNGQGKSSTIFHTDTFMVGKPGVNGGNPQYAFVIGTVNGRYQVAMNTAFIQDLSVDTLKIAGRAVTIPSSLTGNKDIDVGGRGWETVDRMTITGTQRYEPTVCLYSVSFTAYQRYKGSSVWFRIRDELTGNVVGFLSVRDPRLPNDEGDSFVGVGTNLGILYPSSNMSMTVVLECFVPIGRISINPYNIVLLHCKR